MVRAALLALLLLLGLPVTTDPPSVLTYKDLLDRPEVTGGLRFAYGTSPQQFGDLWLPEGAGPHPLLILIHGSCWMTDAPAFSLMNPMAEALRNSGIAVWNIQYRKLWEVGSGYPGTFQDVANAIDHVRVLARTNPLDLSRLILVGHSAGGHLALWAAGRPSLPTDSPLFKADALPVSGVVSLAGIIDLRAYLLNGASSCGGPEVIKQLINLESRGSAAFTDTSPDEASVRAIPLTLVSGMNDHIAPRAFAQRYAAKVGGPELRELEIAGAGHFELIDPQSASWPVILAAIRDRFQQ